MLYDWISNMDFAYPYAFGLLAFIPLMIWWYLKKQNRSRGKVTVSTGHAFTVSTWKIRFKFIPFLLRLLAIISLIIVLARPQKRNDEERRKGQGIDIVLCMDVSGSMGSKDILPSRMEVAKQVAEEFVRNRPVDRIGLVIFSGESFTQCPITTDRNTLIRQIQTLESRRYLKDGTVIGEGLATAVDRLSKSTGASKVIILITDGKEDPPETRLIDPLTALEIAKAKQVKVYTIGMGKMATDVEEVQTTKPHPKNPAIDFLDEALLNRIANETGGKYFRARDREGLQAVYSQINKMEKSEIEVTTFTHYEELFLPFILAAIFFIFIEVLLSLTYFRRFP